MKMIENGFFVRNETDFVGDTELSYDINKDFTSLKTWRRARKVTLFLIKQFSQMMVCLI